MENLKDKLKEKGYKLTPQRRATLDTIIENQGKHLSTEEIYDMVKENCPEIGLATVYRTLQLLDELDVISKINFDDGCSRYELNTNEDDHQHHHLICLKCGDVIEVEVDLMETLEEEIENNYDFKISDHKVKFFGYCSKCQ
ncbi:Fur family transcriptional regulator [Crassaminicella profunda]|uniref:Fur family transcriptional regulator n=1 Tax=Crassaminicella profunda TaxID=1286698 RepID=UPI001CA6065E|nr:Fur family transcriptional regulator [Crassaminicella profunda]QZY57482.1 transcriptional repressor [Crassaminicella profunda]